MTSILEREVEVRKSPVPRFKINQHPQLKSRFNAAAWTTSHGDTVLLAREVLDTVPTFDQPDVGNLVKLHIGTGNEHIAWRPDGQAVLLEDPRALVVNDEVVLGMTAVIYENGNPVPYPAVTRLPSRDEPTDIPPTDPIFDFGPGKNMTPVDEDTFFFRPESTNHSLSVLTRVSENGEMEQTGVLVFPDSLEWAFWRIGTTSPPIWINEQDALMFFHGISIIDGVYVYAIGRAIIHKDSNWTISLRKIDSKPFLQQSDFMVDGQDPIRELHSERKAMYMCGHTVDFGVVSMYPSLGDTETKEVETTLKDLIEEDW